MSDFNLFNSISNSLIQVLPLSPFKGIVYNLESSEVQEILSYLNWFIPINEMINILSAWLAAITLYYLYVVILRWIKVIK